MDVPRIKKRAGMPTFWDQHAHALLGYSGKCATEYSVDTVHLTVVSASPH